MSGSIRCSTCGEIIGGERRYLQGNRRDPNDAWSVAAGFSAIVGAVPPGRVSTPYPW